MIIRPMLLAAGFLLPTVALAGPTADAVRFFYDNIGSETAPENRDRFTGKARAYLDANDRMWAEKEEVCLDFGLSVDGQDFDEAEITRTLELLEDTEGREAHVTATFTLFGEPRSIDWSLIEEEGGWKVDDIVSNTTGWRMSEFTCG